MRYLRCGAGPHLVLVHGLLGYSYCWRKNFATLGRHFTVTAMDLPGVGFSDRDPTMDCSLQASAERMLEFMRRLGIEEGFLLGNSQGGALAMRMALIARERGAPRFQALILAAPAHPWLKGNPLLPLALTGPFQWVVPRIAPAIRATHRIFHKRMYGDPRRMSREDSAGYAAALKVPGTVPHVVNIMRHWKQDMRRLAEDLPQLADVPTLLLWGDRDRAVPIASAPKLRHALPHAEFAVIRGAGHLCFEEEPAEFDRIVIDFLRRHAR